MFVHWIEHELIKRDLLFQLSQVIISVILVATHYAFLFDISFAKTAYRILISYRNFASEELLII